MEWLPAHLCVGSPHRALSYCSILNFDMAIVYYCLHLSTNTWVVSSTHENQVMERPRKAPSTSYDSRALVRWCCVLPYHSFWIYFLSVSCYINAACDVIWFAKGCGALDMKKGGRMAGKSEMRDSFPLDFSTAYRYPKQTPALRLRNDKRKESRTLPQWKFCS